MTLEELVEIEKQLRIDHPELGDEEIEIVLILVLAGCRELKPPKEEENGKEDNGTND